MRASAAVLGIVAPCLIGLTLAGLMQHEPGVTGMGSEWRTERFVYLTFAAVLLYLAAVGAVLRERLPDRAVWWVLGVAALLRALVLFAPPFLSSDLYRYIWDGRVQLAGINPYRFVPADPALAALRDDAIYPHINRAETAPTIYPPAAQLLFAGIAAVSPTVTGMKAAMVGCEAVAMAAVVVLLGRAGLPRCRVLIYAWNPLAVWEFAGNGHVDALVIAAIALALLVRAGGRDGLAGVALAAAVLTKFLPIVLAPALWRRWDWRMPAAFIVAVSALYACFIGVGARVIGFMPGYAGEEGMLGPGAFYPLRVVAELVDLSARAGAWWLGGAGSTLAIVGLALAMRRYPTVGSEIVSLARKMSALATGVILVLTPHYAWYFPWLALPACLAPSFAPIWLSSAAILVYFDPVHDPIIWPSLVYGPALVSVVIELTRFSAKRIRT